MGFMSYNRFHSKQRSDRREAAHDVYVSHDRVSPCVHARFACVDEMEERAERACLCYNAVECVHR